MLLEPCSSSALQLGTGGCRAFRPGRGAVWPLFGEVSGLTAVVYGLVGVTGLYQALFWKRVQSPWMQQASHHA
jgi:hypothetical protein